LLLLGYAALSAVDHAHARMFVDVAGAGNSAYEM